MTVWRFGVNDPLQWNDTASNGRSRYLVEYGVDPFTGDALSGFSDNVSSANTGQGYDITGTPASGAGNGSHDSFRCGTCLLNRCHTLPDRAQRCAHPSHPAQTMARMPRCIAAGRLGQALITSSRPSSWVVMESCDDA